MDKKSSVIKRIALDALLTAAALIIFIVEAQIPPVVPIPGVKLGLANVVTVFALFRLGAKDTLAILLGRILLGAAFSGSVNALVFSLAGGLLCYLAMLLLKRILSEKQIWVCGVTGAVCHNLGQTVAATVLLRSGAVWYYFPVLVLSGIVTGLFTGLCAQIVYLRIGKRI